MASWRGCGSVGFSCLGEHCTVPTRISGHIVCSVLDEHIEAYNFFRCRQRYCTHSHTHEHSVVLFQTCFVCANASGGGFDHFHWRHPGRHRARRMSRHADAVTARGRLIGGTFRRQRHPLTHVEHQLAQQWQPAAALRTWLDYTYTYSMLAVVDVDACDGQTVRP